MRLWLDSSIMQQNWSMPRRWLAAAFLLGKRPVREEDSWFRGMAAVWTTPRGGQRRARRHGCPESAATRSNRTRRRESSRANRGSNVFDW